MNVKTEGDTISIDGGQVVEACDLVVPGDISSAAFWIVAAACAPGSQLIINNVGLNPTRTALLDVLIRMGAKIEVQLSMKMVANRWGELKSREVSSKAPRS